NLQIQINIIDAALRCAGGVVRKLLFVGSSCIYPKLAPQPISESALLSAPLEPTNEWYAVAKIADIKMCQTYRIQHGLDGISAMPTNLYGSHDNFHPENSHVLPALIRRFHKAKISGAKEVVVWGTGSPLREFLHVDDLADVVVFLMDRYSGKREGGDNKGACGDGEGGSWVRKGGRVGLDEARWDAKEADGQLEAGWNGVGGEDPAPPGAGGYVQVVCG
ncbi:GDP-L-fucose synthase 1, partial [Musa troglodytarum]